MHFFSLPIVLGFNRPISFLFPGYTAQVEPDNRSFPASSLLIVTIRFPNPDPTTLMHFRAHKVIEGCFRKVARNGWFSQTTLHRRVEILLYRIRKAYYHLPPLSHVNTTAGIPNHSHLTLI